MLPVSFMSALAIVWRITFVANRAWVGGLWCLLAIFLPAWLLIGDALPFWQQLRAKT